MKIFHLKAQLGLSGKTPDRKTDSIKFLLFLKGLGAVLSNFIFSETLELEQ
jgi:hypothetical protein